jgi:hypothetical protein
MKVALESVICNSAAEVQVKITAWIDSKPEKFFADGINKLPRRWQELLTMKETILSIFLSVTCEKHLNTCLLAETLY